MTTRPRKKLRLSRKEKALLFAEAKPQHPAVLLAQALANADVSIKRAAPVIGVSPYSVYLWISGDVEPTAGKVTIVRRLTAALDSAIEAGELPLMGRPGTVEEIIRRHL